MSIAMNSAVSGMAALQRMLDVVGGNISNASTTGYKSESITFKELMTEKLRNAQAANGRLGSVNPSQVGTGVITGSVTQNYSQGGISVTGRPSDIAINGDGFFALRDVSGGLAYTRAGSFTLDTTGYLVSPDGLKLQGWPALNGTVDTRTAVDAITIPMGRATMSRATANATFGGNLDASSDTYAAGPPPTGGTYTTENTLYDSLGATHVVTITFTRNATPVGQGGNWSWSAKESGNVVGTGAVAFTNAGLYDVANSTPLPTVAFTPTNGALPMSVNLELTGLTQFSDVNSVLSRAQDGFPPGVLQDFAVGQDGTITGSYSNGLKSVLGRLALATCSNNEGLDRGDGGLLYETASSGPMLLAPAQGNGFTAGALESSNVDLGLEFTNMIVAQRAFQANARMITTMDQVLNELTNLRR